MDIFPNEYQNLNLNRNEKMFIRYAEACSEKGYLFLNTNPSMQDSEVNHILINKNGVLVMKFFEKFNASDFSTIIPILVDNVYLPACEIIRGRLLSNKALVSYEGKLKISFNYCYIFPDISRKTIKLEGLSNDKKSFIQESCIFKEDFSEFKINFYEATNYFLNFKVINRADNYLLIDDTSINAVIQRIAPEYTIIRNAILQDETSFRGADNELLIVGRDDSVIKAFRLDNDQINIVNKISKGEQLILACAGSGKSVLLIAKCFKAAQMNPKKKFLITCKSKKLQSLYTMYIDRAGLKERNVECKTFHKLCQDLLTENKLPLPNEIDDQPNAAIKALSNGKIGKRYYGIFIDEIQEFEQEWYKFCYNLLENKNTEDHLFVICGDKTQKISKAQKKGQAPWNAGEGYPSYRGGNKSIRIEKNYRNCIEINDFINKYVIKAREALFNISGNDEIDPDLFLRGKSTRNGIGTFFIELKKRTSEVEAQTVYECIKKIHDHYMIPYDEIAVIMFNKEYNAKIKGWDETVYNFYEKLVRKLNFNNIDCFDLYKETNFGLGEGVTLVSFQSSLGLDFRAVIVCGFAPFGYYSRTKELKIDEIYNISDDMANSLKTEVNQIYVACTRARDILYIVQPERESFYMKMLYSAYKEE